MCCREELVTDEDMASSRVREFAETKVGPSASTWWETSEFPVRPGRQDAALPIVGLVYEVAGSAGAPPAHDVVSSLSSILSRPVDLDVLRRPRRLGLRQQPAVPLRRAARPR